MLFKGRRKIIAVFFLSIFSLQLFWPTVSYALTTGPSQPEMEKFEAAGVSDMVDLFTGDMRYNIPIMDVGGYPINLAYQSGAGVEEEASWVGMGWTLNPGSLTRQMRGLPDDFDGKATQRDLIEKDYDRKEFRKVGGNIVIKPSIFAWETGKASLKMSVYKDNYYGIGSSIGASLTQGINIPGRNSLSAGLDLDLNSDVRDGLDIAPSFQLSHGNINVLDNRLSNTFSIGPQYNTRAGLKGIKLSFYSTVKHARNGRTNNISGSAMTYVSQSYTPSISVNTMNSAFTFNADAGPSVVGFYKGIGGGGFYYREKIRDHNMKVPAYGFMNYLKGRKDKLALLDFNREKDGVFIPSAPAIAIPIATHDLFMATGQAGSMQFRPHFGGNYVVFDREHSTNSTNTGLGLTIGGINIFKGGGRVDVTTSKSLTGKWVENNYYLNSAEPEFATGLTHQQPVSFKQNGELTINNQSYVDDLGGTDAAKVALMPGMLTGPGMLKKSSTHSLPGGGLKKEVRDKKTSVFQYLNNNQARGYGLNRTQQVALQLNDTYRAPHHMSEVTITDAGGQRMVYGIPVYNSYQEEVTFSIPKPTGTTEQFAKRSGLIGYTVNPSNPDRPLYKYGRDELYSREKMPAFSTGFLLTGVLSPDYVDLTNNSITDDDLGTAVKFDYTRHQKNYKWRAPFQANTANYNEGLLSDPKDDKASYVYGEKEIWYLNTIQSKTMIAIFHTEDREDGFGVAGKHGGISDQSTQKRLKKIVLYSKADYTLNGENATPIKTAHFEYDYSLYPGTPNSTAGGRLTLKKVYFTFGKNERGKSNPYEFVYQSQTLNDGNITNMPKPVPPTSEDEDPLLKELNEVYTERQVDRWGTYKQSWYNNLTGTGNLASTMNNSEYPYALQKIMPPADVAGADWSAFIDRMSAQWQLSQVITPSGGKISIEYEADDYAFVQDRRAMNMYSLNGIEEEGQATGLVNADRIVVNLPVAVEHFDEFMDMYMRKADGTYLDKIYYKFYTDMDNITSNTKNKHWEYVYGYAEIDRNQSNAWENVAVIALKKRNGYNPIAKGAWQMLKAELPQYAYDGYDNSDVGNDFEAAIKSIFQAIKNIGSELKSFDKRASKRGYANRVDLSKSMVRLFVPQKTTSPEDAPVNRKNGGGLRVKKIQISDEWSEMTDQTAGVTNTYGQVYDYALRDDDGNYIMSSGVAAYEPMIGGEENPFREPVPFSEKVHWQRDRHHYIERPYCESYFPGPSVGYSRVAVTSFGADYTGSGTPEKHIGEVVHEFYTAQEFPTKVEELLLDKREYENSLLLRLFASKSSRKMATSQGFSVILNNMHGKPKSLKYFNKAGDLVSSTRYFYNVETDQPDKLNNVVPVLNSNGTITSATLGEDLDFVTDVRESVNSTVGLSTGTYLGATVFGFFGMGYGSYIPVPTTTYIKYNSISAVKVVNRTGIVKKVVTTQDGSTLEAENLLWDGITGQVLLVKNQTEFDGATYSLNYPAHMVEQFKDMGPASESLGTLFPSLVTNSSGLITSISNLTQLEYFTPGDELIHATVPFLRRGWIIKGPNATTNNQDFRLIDANGDFIETSGEWLLVRSGKRNMIAASVGSVVLMKDPRVGNTLQADVSKRILDAQAVLYKQEWPVAVNQEYGIDPDQCSKMRTNCLDMFLIRSLTKTLENGGTNNIRRAFFSTSLDNTTTTNVHADMTQASCQYFASVDGQTDGAFYWEDALATVPQSGGGIDYTISPGDLLRIGDYRLTVTTVDPDFIALANSQLSDAALAFEFNRAYTNQHNRKYCLYKAGDCSYVFRMIVSCEEGPPTGGASTTCEISSLCTYKDIFSFTLENLGDPVHTCLDPEGRRINPYNKGILGNWRPLQSYVFTTTRNNTPGIKAQPGGTDIRNNGYYNVYTPFWSWQSNKLQTQVDPSVTYAASDLRSRWIGSGRSIYFDQRGNEVENVDVLNRYGAAIFGYDQSLAIAVAGNSRRNEIMFDGFEDYDFQINYLEDCAPSRHFDWGLVNNAGTWENGGGQVSSVKSHTGRYSYYLNGSFSLQKTAGSSAPGSGPVLDYDGTGKYILNSNEMAKGFAPVEGKKYVFSCWVNDGNPNVNAVNGLTLLINGATVSGIVPVVEGWKKVEHVFTAGEDFNISVTGTGIYLDDIRIHPFDGQMASYVYDNKSLRLMAQMDENNFATLYEYDNEGTPIRVKKETERGVMTISESRQSLRKR